MKSPKDKLTDDQKQKLVKGAQFIKGGDDVDKLFDEIETLMDIATNKPKDEKSHAE